MAGPYYIDANWGGAQSGTELEPFVSPSQLTGGSALVNGDTVYVKRNSVFGNEQWVIDTLTGITIDAYGTGNKPVFSYIDNTDTDPNDWVYQGGNIWKRTTTILTSNFSHRLMQCGDNLQPVQMRTSSGDVIDSLGDWDDYKGDDVSEYAYILLYCPENPVDYWGYVSWGSSGSGALILKQSEVTVSNLKFVDSIKGIDVTDYRTGTVHRGSIYDCEMDGCWNGIQFRGADGLGTHSQDSIAARNRITNSRSVGIYANQEHFGLIIEDNEIITTGNQSSIGGIYLGRCFGDVASRVTVRRNYIDGIEFGNYWKDGHGIYSDNEGSYQDWYENTVVNLDLSRGAALRTNSPGLDCYAWSNRASDCAVLIETYRFSNTETTGIMDWHFWNNTGVNINNSGIRIGSNNMTGGTLEFRNNVAVGVSGVSNKNIEGGGSIPAIVDANYNAFYNFPNGYDSGVGINDVLTDPQLSNYRPASGSDIEGAGTDLTPLNDINGVAFDSTPNMGAYSGTADLYAINTGNTATLGEGLNYDGIWTTVDWQTNEDRSIHYPMNEGA